jgi:polysaccharide biosynthesis/export protein
MDRLKAFQLACIALLCLAIAPHALAQQSLPTAAPATTQGTTPPPESNASSAPSPNQPAAPSSGGSEPDLVIGVGDLLDISVYGAPDSARTVRVGKTGDVLLPMIGRVKLAGLTVESAERQIEKQLAAGGYYNQPQVTIFEKEPAAQGISVLGEVQRPGIYPLFGTPKLFDVISAAGGTTPRAGRKVTISRRSGESEAINFTQDSSDPKANPKVQPGDTVVVSKAGVVYVVGDVRLPSGIVMDKPGLTVAQAIAMAQGTNPTASLGRAKLVRRSANGPTEVPIPLEKILEAKAPDIPLEADDIIFIPNSAAKSATRRGLEAIIQAATGVAIYRHP